MDIGPPPATEPLAPDDACKIENNEIHINNQVLNDVDVFCMTRMLNVNFKNQMMQMQ